MSMNVYITASRQITVNKTGEEDTQTIKFNAFQTRTHETYNIIQSNNPLEAYREWIIERIPNNDKSYPVYSEDDFFGERDPISIETYNSYKNHLEEFDNWVEMCNKKGYDIKIDMI